MEIHHPSIESSITTALSTTKSLYRILKYIVSFTSVSNENGRCWYKILVAPNTTSNLHHALGTMIRKHRHVAVPHVWTLQSKINLERQFMMKTIDYCMKSVVHDVACLTKVHGRLAVGVLRGGPDTTSTRPRNQKAT